MITRQRVSLLLLLLFFTASSALAAPIGLITDGALVGNSFDAELRVTQRGLTIDAGGNASGGIWGISHCQLGCSPGVLLPFDAVFSGSDFGGDVTVLGRTFPVGLATDSVGSLAVEFRASAVLPAFAGQPLISLRTPFSFEGRLSTPDLPADLYSQYGLSGTGTATLRFEWSPNFSGWVGHSGRYDFVATPEPSTLVMTGVSLAGLSLARRVRRRPGQRVAPRADLHGRSDA